MRDLVVPFFEDTDNCAVLTHVKFSVFDKPAGGPIMDEENHPTLRACFAHPAFPLVKGNLPPFVK